MRYLIRLAQVHETFRRPELEALAALMAVEVTFLFYDDSSPFCVIDLRDEAAAKALIGRSILAKAIYELWGEGIEYEQLHADVRARTADRWVAFKNASFKFSLDAYQGKRSSSEKTQLIQSFSYLGFQGPIKMGNPDEEFCIFEEYDRVVQDAATPRKEASPHTIPLLEKLYFGRYIASSSRDVIDRYDLKKRQYISTTSMDAELTLVTANMAHAAPGRLFFDPFVGTGSFCVAVAHFGAHTLGSDIDGRSFKGPKVHDRSKQIGLLDNLKQYELEGRFIEVFTSDLTNTPLRDVQFLDGIICDPPYGIREGLKVLGPRDGKTAVEVVVDGIPTHKMEGYVPPKKPYSFVAMIDDILDFAAHTLVFGGRLSFWMPTANEDDEALEIPSHPQLRLVSMSIQPFNKWSRRLLTYQRLASSPTVSLMSGKRHIVRGSADELNAFRRHYFKPKDPKK